MAGQTAERINPDEANFTLQGSAIDGVMRSDRKDDSQDSAMFERLKRMAKDGIDHMQVFWAEDDENADYYAGRQWTETDQNALARQLRPTITFNKTGPILDSLVGLEINNREMTKVYPRKQGNVKQSELWTAGLMWVREMANAEGEECDAFMDVARSGLGCVDTYLATSEREAGAYDMGMDRVDPKECFFDPSAVKRNLRDTRYRGRVRSIPIDSARELFPDCEDYELHAGWAQTLDDGMDVSRLPENYLFNGSSQSGLGLRKNVTIVEIQWWEYEPYYQVEDPYKKTKIHMDQATFNEASRRMRLLVPGFKLNSAKYRRKVHKRAFLGARILKRPPLPCPYDFSLQFITGKRDKTKRHWFGLMRAMKDPQMWANKWLSQIMHILNSNAKGGILADKNVFDDWQKVEKNWSNPAFIAWLAAGKTPDQVGYRQQAPMPQGLFELMNFAISSVPDANGISQEILGLADRDQPSSLEYQRRQAGMSVLAIFFDALRMYRKAQGKIALYMIQKWMADGRLVRVAVEAGDEQYIPLLMSQDEGVIEYDLIVDESPSSPNQKEMVWSMLVQAMPMLSGMNIPPEIWGELMAYSPLPASIVQKIKETAKGNPQADQEQAMMQRMTLALMGAQVKQLEGQAMESAADVTAKNAKAAKDATEADQRQLAAAAQRTAAVGQVINQPPEEGNAPTRPATPQLAGQPQPGGTPAPQAAPMNAG